MAGYTRQDTANNISNGNVIDADDFDNEYNAIEAAFNSTTGHKHDGTSAEGAPITVIGPAQDVVASATDLKGKANNTYDLGTTGLKWKDLHLAGTANAPTVSSTSITTTNLTTTNFTLGGTAVTSTAEELNILDGVTSTATELNILDGVTSTTAELNLLDGVTSTTAELNILDGVTSTTAELNILDGVTSTTAELNILDGVTATAAELNILDGVTATAIELNILDGVTATTTELNYVDGVTSSIQSQLDNLAAANHTHLLSAITDVTSTAAELNILDGVTSTTAELNILDGVTSTTAQLNVLDDVTETNFNDAVAASKLAIQGGTSTYTSFVQATSVSYTTGYGVGSYIFAWDVLGGTDVYPGMTVAGSGLFAAGFNNGSVVNTDGDASGRRYTTPVLMWEYRYTHSGTWRAIGHAESFNSTGSGGAGAATLWIRIL